VSKATGKHKDKALTAVAVRALNEPGFYADGNGLYLKVIDSGAKRWVQRLLIKGRRRDIGLGSASLVTLAEAREAALVNRKLARSGGDPLRAKKEAEAVLTFAEAAEQVLVLHRPTWRNAKHAQQWINTLSEYAFPKFGKTLVSDVTTSDVLSALSPIWNTKPETARRVKQRIGTVMKWAVAKGWRQDNPADAIATALPKQDASKKQHRKALPYSEVAACIDTVKASGAGLTTKLALEFVVLTACRSGEARMATWAEFDLDVKEWRIPGERMKSKRDHRVPLSGRVLEILTEAKVLSSGDNLVFAGTKSGKPLSDMTLSKLVKELGFEADVHGFRTSFKTWAQERTNFAREVSEMALAHVIQNKAEAAYARSDLFEKRRMMMESWAAFVAQERGEVIRIGV
jgi:integrase